MYLESIDVRLEGKQPALKLHCSVCIKSSPSALPVAISVDFMDDKFNPIMQAMPNYQPFIGGAKETSYVDMTIELPPLVPGIYPLKFWIGVPNFETQDWVSDAIAIEITDSPSVDRAFPHFRDQGFIVANSTAVVRAD